MDQWHGGRLFVETLKREGVRYIFTLSGESLLPVIDACIDAPIEVIHTRHEETAGYMADAYARVTGTLGVVGVTQGPGTSNILTCLMTANLEGSPVLCFAGRINDALRHRSAEQDLDPERAASPYVKWAAEISSGARIPELTATAIRHAMTGIPGATMLAFQRATLHETFDPAAVEIPRGYRTPGLSNRSRSADAAAIEQAAALLRTAERPLIIVGFGAAWCSASQTLTEFVDRTGIPTLMNSTGRGCLDESHELSLGDGSPSASPTTRRALAEADVILLVGERMDYHADFGDPDTVNPAAKIIQIWPRAEEIGLNRSVEAGLVSDARSGLEDLLSAYGKSTEGTARTDWNNRLRAEKDEEYAAFEEILANPPTPIHPLVLTHEVKRYLEEADVPYSVACGASDIDCWVRWAFAFSRMGQYIGSGYTGTLGAGFPFAMAMKLARPEDNVVCLLGDGDFGYQAMDLDTCLRYDIPMVSVIANDSTWGFIKREQEALFGANRTYATDLEFRNYEKVCEALGGHGELVRETSEIRPALERAFASGKPAVVNVVIDRIPSPLLNWMYKDIDPRSGPLGSG